MLVSKVKLVLINEEGRDEVSNPNSVISASEVTMHGYKRKSSPVT